MMIARNAVAAVWLDEPRDDPRGLAAYEADVAALIDRAEAELTAALGPEAHLGPPTLTVTPTPRGLLVTVLVRGFGRHDDALA